MKETLDFFAKNLIDWYLDNKRDLPWRSTKDPYFIWLSEIILQQTRVAQGTPYYLAFTSAFGDVKSLADAPQAKVLKLWQGLGYYSRARNLHIAAKYVANELDGIFPATYNGLLELKGVGDYTASAVGSICFDLPNAVVDGNVYRVLSRIFGISTPINTTQGVKDFKALAQQLLDTSQPGTYNQALMEFGARFCVPQNPNCEQCLFQYKCDAYKNKQVSVLPVKLKKLKVKKRYFNYIVLLSEDQNTVLQQRTDKGIWQQLYEFPLVETQQVVDEFELREELQFSQISALYGIDTLTLYKEKAVIHKLSHQHLYTRFWIAQTKSKLPQGLPIDKIDTYAVPVLISNFISGFEGFK
ncbi:MAG: Adenine DNA glycosylase [Flavobacteriaceae bacterium]|nr:MAG: Adenine DNA glycosylase [Flavobacteriaceae bacterium]